MNLHLNKLKMKVLKFADIIGAFLNLQLVCILIQFAYLTTNLATFTLIDLQLFINNFDGPYLQKVSILNGFDTGLVILETIFSRNVIIGMGLVSIVICHYLHLNSFGCFLSASLAC